MTLLIYDGVSIVSEDKEVAGVGASIDGFALTRLRSIVNIPAHRSHIFDDGDGEGYFVASGDLSGRGFTECGWCESLNLVEGECLALSVVHGVEVEVEVEVEVVVHNSLFLVVCFCLMQR